MTHQEFIDTWLPRLEQDTPEQILRWALAQFGTDTTFATSLGAEDQVLLAMLAKDAAEIPVFMLDTGRHFEETYALLEQNRQAYSVPIRSFFPASDDVEKAVNQHGSELFRTSVALRKHCCFIRKVKPLRRALAGKRAWITGQRREQAVTRNSLAPLEWDEANQMFKINPLFAWSQTMVWDFIQQHRVPYNSLHDQQFPSISCAPCTRAVEPGEDLRAGRWWWEQPESKECGLHWIDGKPVRRQHTFPELVSQ